MCKSKDKGGIRCELSDNLSNLRRKVRYSKEYNETNSPAEKKRILDEKIREWKDKNKTMVIEHSPKSTSFTTRSKKVDTGHIPLISVNDIILDERIEDDLYSDYQRLEDLSKKDGYSDQVESIRDYSFMSYKDVNQYLKDGYNHEQVEHNENLREKYGFNSHRVGKDLDLLMDKYASDRDVKVLRHITVPAGWTGKQYADKYYSPGSLVRHREFLSTTHSPEYVGYRGKRDSHKQHLAFIIHTDKSLPISRREDKEKDNIQSQEYERILPRNERFRVIGTGLEDFTSRGDKVSGKHKGKIKMTVIHLMQEDIFKKRSKDS